MNVADAAYAVVHDYPGGSESLAPRIGMSAAILRNKVNPNNETHRLTLDEAVRISALTCDKRILHAFAQEVGSVAMDEPTADDAAASDVAVLELVSRVWASNGDLGTVIHRALADGRITSIELDEVNQAAADAQREILKLVRRLEGLKEPE